MARRGSLIQLAPGVYMDPEADLGAHLELIVVAKRAPDAVVCGLSALSVHALTSQLPRAVEVAIERGSWAPKLSWPTLEVVRLSGAAWSHGVEEQMLHGVMVRVYSAAKTVADLFRFRARYGVDVATEALREGWDEGRFTMAQLEAAATACRVSTVMRPYMEMLI